MKCSYEHVSSTQSRVILKSALNVNQQLDAKKKHI